MTALTPHQLVELRARARNAPGSQFINPRAARLAQDVIRRRGRPWVAAIVGYDASRNSPVDASMPYLTQHGDLELLVAADAVETEAAELAALAGIAAASQRAERGTAGQEGATHAELEALIELLREQIAREVQVHGPDSEVRQHLAKAALALLDASGDAALREMDQ